MLHVYVYCYFNLCIYNVFVFLHFIYNASARTLCVYILIACSSKKLCAIVQLDTGYVTVCSAVRKQEHSLE
jgi:hypothetical protein